MLVLTLWTEDSFIQLGVSALRQFLSAYTGEGMHLNFKPRKVIVDDKLIESFNSILIMNPFFNKDIKKKGLETLEHNKGKYCYLISQFPQYNILSADKMYILIAKENVELLNSQSNAN